MNRPGAHVSAIFEMPLGNDSVSRSITAVVLVHGTNLCLGGHATAATYTPGAYALTVRPDGQRLRVCGPVHVTTLMRRYPAQAGLALRRSDTVER